jgi:subfamily B ATP-binding cassette protein MsbA
MQVLAGNSVLSPAMFIVYIAIFTQIINPAKNIATAFSNFKRGVAALDRIYDVLESPEKIAERENPIVLKGFQESIRFENLSFAYHEMLVLENINIEIKKGEVCALVGPSGSGKSTIVDLLPRFYDATRGRILFDGEDLRDCELKSLRSQFAMVTQDIVLFNDTIFNSSMN